MMDPIYVDVQILGPAEKRYAYDNPEWHWWAPWRPRALSAACVVGTSVRLTGEFTTLEGFHVGRTVIMCATGEARVVLSEDRSCTVLAGPLLTVGGAAVIV